MKECERKDVPEALAEPVNVLVAADAERVLEARTTMVMAGPRSCLAYALIVKAYTWAVLSLTKRRPSGPNAR